MKPTARITAYPLIAAAALAVSACDKTQTAPPPPPFVEVMEITTTGVPLTTTLIGQLDSPQNVEVRARVEGIVEKMFFTEGTEVQEGDLLFELDKRPFLERLAAANGMLAESLAALN